MDTKTIPDRDISNIEDIRLLVDTFYDKIKKDPLLGDIFNVVIKDRWPQHLEKMYRFWQTILLDEHTYNGRPFPPHAALPIHADHFEAWLKLWHSTVDQFFVGPLATDAKERGSKMASLFFSKIEYYRNSSAKPLF